MDYNNIGGQMTPGKKAAITRQKNKISARQRKAAFKAWKTRRANA
jgi:hypothetical protein